MMTLRQLAAEPSTLPTRTTWYLTDLAEARGKQELFTRQSPQKLKVLREPKGELALVSRLLRRMSGLERLNPGLPPEAIIAAVDELTRDPAIAGLPRLLSGQVSLSAAEKIGSLSPNQNRT